MENRISVSTRGRRVQRRSRRGQPGAAMARAMPSHCRLSPRDPRNLSHTLLKRTHGVRSRWGCSSSGVPSRINEAREAPRRLCRGRRVWRLPSRIHHSHSRSPASSRSRIRRKAAAPSRSPPRPPSAESRRSREPLESTRSARSRSSLESPQTESPLMSCDRWAGCDGTVQAQQPGTRARPSATSGGKGNRYRHERTGELGQSPCSGSSGAPAN